MKARALFGVLTVLGAAAWPLPAPAEPLAYVTNWCCSVGSLSVLAGTEVVSPRIETGIHPTDIVMSRYGGAYVAHGDFSGAAGNGVSLISTSTLAVYREINVSPLTATGVALSRDERRLYVTHGTSSRSVSVIDTETFAPIASIALEDHGHRIAVTPDGTRAVVTSLGENSVAFIDLQTSTLIETVSIGVTADAVAITPDGRRAYVTNGTWATVTVLDMVTRAEVDTIQLPEAPYRIAILPTGARAYITNPDADSVSVLDLATNVVATVPVGARPLGIALTQDGTRAYVVNQSSNSVSVIDTTVDEVVATVADVGDLPTSVAITLGPPRPPFPVILIPGLLGDSSTWKKFGDVLEYADWALGGCPLSICAGGVEPSVVGLPAGDFDFYRMEFSSNQTLTFLEQGQELDRVISAVLAATNKARVILVAHSMGGLAARSYLQKVRPHDHRVAQLITIGTPHRGAEVAHACRNAPTLECSVIGTLLGLDFFSVAVRELDPSYLQGQSQLWDLADLIQNPLPPDIAYVSLRGTGTLLLDDPALGYGDGIVTEISQNLLSVPGASQLLPRLTSLPLLIKDGPCDPLDSILNTTEVRETHTCETEDFLVVRKILQQLERATLTVAAPNGGEIWAIGSGHNVEWNPAGLTGYVTIELSRNGGTSWELVISSTPNDGSHPWTVKGPATTQARIRVTSLTNPTVLDVSDANFTIGGGHLEVTAPNGGETWAIARAQTIRWTSAGLTGYVKIELSRNGGASWEPVISSTPNDGSHSWTVSGPATALARIRITSVTDPTVADVSDGNFTIGGGRLAIATPNGGETWAIGSLKTIRWSSAGLVGNVKIELSRNGGTSWEPVISSTPNDGSHAWTVKGPATTRARIRITSLTDPAVADVSDATFTIGGGRLAIATPNGGETWAIGSLNAIRWASAGLTGNVKIELSRNGGTSWELVISSTPNDGSHAWTVKGPATTQARIRITSATDPTVADVSDANFTIGGGRLEVTSPNGGETWTVGTLESIQWASAGLTGNVKIEVSRNSGVSWAAIIASTANDGAFTWTVTGPATTQARIRVTSLTDPTVKDTSDANFTIR